MEKNKKLDYISQKIIADKSENKISEFIVLSNAGFTNNDYIFKPKFSEIVANFGEKPVEYQLKRTIEGNPDEGRQSQNGKALRLTVNGDTVIIGIYTQMYGARWAQSHTYTIDKVHFDAYALVVKNDADIAKKEKEKKSPDDFSLDL